MADTTKKKSFIRKIQDFLASYNGKVILNYAYSWGAAVVILGALFKLVHLPGANMMLFVGMGTEVLVFFISGFDRPFKSYKWESIFPNLKISGSEYDKKKNIETEHEEGGADPLAAFQSPFSQPVQGGGAPIIIGGGYPAAGGSGNIGNVTAASTSEVAGGQAASTINPAGGPAVISIGGGGSTPVTPGVEVSPEMEEATKAYLEQLKDMTQALNTFVEQTRTLGQDAEQINVLNKNLTGINAVYEIQLRNISIQLGTIDEINEQTRKMAKQIEELNQVYARMLEAMTVNMKTN